MVSELFESSSRGSGDFSGIFEYDGSVGFFYLYDNTVRGRTKIVGAIHIISEEADFDRHDFSISWNHSQDIVGLFIRHQLWAAFDINGNKYGGDYDLDGVPMVPDEITLTFSTN